MTEAEWLACEDPVVMLHAAQPVGTNRKLRLLLTHAARSVWHRLTLPELQQAVEVAEQYVEGEVSADVLKQASSMLFTLATQQRLTPERAAWFRNLPENGDFFFVALGGTISDGKFGDLERSNRWRAITGRARQLPDLFRELFGSQPFRPVTFAPEWRTDTVRAIAHQMYASREFSAMPILADALQDAGCDNSDILSHCRREGRHVRGCWVCDLVLDKS